MFGNFTFKLCLNSGGVKGRTFLFDITCGNKGCNLLLVKIYLFVMPYRCDICNCPKILFVIRNTFAILYFIVHFVRHDSEFQILSFHSKFDIILIILNNITTVFLCLIFIVFTVIVIQYFWRIDPRNLISNLLKQTNNQIISVEVIQKQISNKMMSAITFM